MPGYPCCCRQQPNCGECHGTAPQQYQLTVPEGLFTNNPDATPEGCGDACEDYNGIFLLDRDPELMARTGPAVSCIWQTPDIELCYECHGLYEPIEGGPIVCTTLTWNWRIELADDFGDDGYVSIYALLFSTPYSYTYVWSGQFYLDCSAPVELHYEPVFLNYPAEGCVPDPTGTLLLEVAP